MGRLEPEQSAKARPFHVVVGAMMFDQNSLSRIAKLFIDRDDLTAEEAMQALARLRVIVKCGPEILRSTALQAAALTAANIASRCFPNAVRVDAPDGRLIIPWAAGCGLRDAFAASAGKGVLEKIENGWDDALIVGVGSVDSKRPGVQLTFDGWTCAVSPLDELVRLPERDGCVLAGVAAGGLAVSELFLGNFGFAIEAGSRCIGLSLWRPDLPWDDARSAGIDAPIDHLPEELWLLGLGHLGQAAAWTLGMLPFSAPEKVKLVLQDFDRVVRANLDTGLLSVENDVGRLKTRVVGDFLEARGFRPHLVERRFDEHTRPQYDEPRIMLAGMDGKGPRHLLDQTGFDLAVDSGIGGTVANFDSITLNVVPNARVAASELWPQSDIEQQRRREEEARRLSQSRRVYKDVQQQLGCGHVELAGRSAAVPFVGALASTLSVSELLRRMMGATQFDRVRLQLTSPFEPSTAIAGGERLRTACQPALQYSGRD